MFLIYALLLTCAVGLAAFVYRYDLCRREPWYMVFLAFGFGFAAMWVAGAVEDVALMRLGVTREHIAAKAATVALVETAARVFMVLTFASAFRARFVGPLDGLMYGTLGGLGMAVEESLLYLSLAPANPHTLGVEVVRLFAHSLMGGLVGFAVGQWVRPNLRPHPKPILSAGCLGVAMLVHFSWDFIAYQNSRDALLKLLPMLLMLSLMLVWGGLVAYASEQAPAAADKARVPDGAGDADEDAAPDAPLA